MRIEALVIAQPASFKWKPEQQLPLTAKATQALADYWKRHGVAVQGLLEGIEKPDVDQALVKWLQAVPRTPVSSCSGPDTAFRTVAGTILFAKTHRPSA